MNEIYAFNTDVLLDTDIYDEWYNRMPVFRKEKIDKFKPQASKRLSLGAGIVLDRALSDIGITEYEIEYGINEKPYLKGRGDVFFNISHSGKYAVCVISDMEIGVDIQEEKTFSEALVKHVFTPDEIAYVKRNVLDQKGADNLYTKMWTIKESVMKYFGIGLSMNPQKILITMGDTIHVDYEGMDCGQLNFFSYDYDEIKLTICSKYNNFTKSITFL